MSRALELCLAQLGSGKSKQLIGDEIGYSRTAVSLYSRGLYGESVEALEAAILARYDRRECPHTGEAIAPELCIKKALAPKPFGGTSRQAWWMTCQSCVHKPAGEAK